jgi:hypothetical protein
MTNEEMLGLQGFIRQSASLLHTLYEYIQESIRTAWGWAIQTGAFSTKQQSFVGIEAKFGC